MDIAQRLQQRDGQPKYELVKDWLRERIESGEYPPGSRLPTQDELPGMLKVGGVTVRRALNDLAREGLIVQRRRAGSFVADHRHPPLIPGRNLHLGLLWNEDVQPHALHSTFCGAMTRGALVEWSMEHETADWSASGRGATTGCLWNLVERGLKVQCVGQLVRSRERHPPLRAILKAGFDGVICLSILEDDWLNQLLDSGLPAVLVDYPANEFRDRCDQVYVDPLCGYRNAVADLVAAGMTRVHFVGVHHRMPSDSPDMPLETWLRSTDRRMRADPDSYLRLNAFRQGMEEAGMYVAEDQVHFCAYDPGVLEALGNHLASLPDDKRPQAVVCHETRQAEVLMERFRFAGLPLRGMGAAQRGYKGPAQPVTISGEQVGAVAADLLVARLQKPQRPKLNVGVAMEWQPKSQMAATTKAVQRIT